MGSLILVAALIITPSLIYFLQNRKRFAEPFMKPFQELLPERYGNTETETETESETESEGVGAKKLTLLDPDKEQETKNNPPPDPQ